MDFNKLSYLKIVQKQFSLQTDDDAVT